MGLSTRDRRLERLNRLLEAVIDRSCRKRLQEELFKEVREKTRALVRYDFLPSLI